MAKNTPHVPTKQPCWTHDPYNPDEGLEVVPEKLEEKPVHWPPPRDSVPHKQRKVDPPRTHSDTVRLMLVAGVLFLLILLGAVMVFLGAPYIESLDDVKEVLSVHTHATMLLLGGVIGYYFNHNH